MSAENILKTAKEFATNAHESIQQKRKFTNEPYHFHCERVVKILQEVTKDADVLAAAWMHDVLEDVAPKNPMYSEQQIREIFGERITNFVLELTDTPHSFGNRETRKAKDRERLQAASQEAKTIKLADILDNFQDIKNNDPGFAKIYVKEIKKLLPCLEGCNKILFNRLSDLLNFS